MASNPQTRVHDVALSVIKCTGYKIRASFKKDDEQYGDDDCTFPYKNAFFS